MLFDSSTILPWMVVEGLLLWELCLSGKGCCLSTCIITVKLLKTSSNYIKRDKTYEASRNMDIIITKGIPLSSNYMPSLKYNLTFECRSVSIWWTKLAVLSSIFWSLKVEQACAEVPCPCTNPDSGLIWCKSIDGRALKLAQLAAPVIKRTESYWRSESDDFLQTLKSQWTHSWLHCDDAHNYGSQLDLFLGSMLVTAQKFHVVGCSCRVTFEWQALKAMQLHIDVSVSPLCSMHTHECYT